MPASASTQPHIAPDSPRTTSEVGTEDWDVAQTTALAGAQSTQTQPKTAQGPRERVLDYENHAGQLTDTQCCATSGLVLMFAICTILLYASLSKTTSEGQVPLGPVELVSLLCVSVAGLLSLTMSICCVFDARKTHGKLRAPRSPSQALPHPPSPSFPTQANESQAYVCEHRHVYDDLATYLTARHLGEGAAQQADGKSCGTRPGMALEMKGESQRERVGCSS